MRNIAFKIGVLTLLSLHTARPALSQSASPTLFYRVILLKTTEKDSMPTPPDTVNIQRIAITLADSVVYVSRKQQRRVYDFAKEKIYFLNTQAKNYDEAPLFAEIDFRRMEFFNRMGLKNMLNREQIENQVGSRFELESLFGISSSGSEKPTQLIEYNKENVLQYSMRSQPVASFVFSKIPLDAQTRSFSKYLLYETQLHPSIAQALIRQNKVPERMEFAFNNSGKRYKAIYLLEEYKNQTLISEFGHHYYLYAYEANNELKTRINQVYGFVHSNEAAFPRRETVVAKFDQALGKKKYVESFLILTESNLASNENYDSEFARLKELASKDQTFQGFLNALFPPENQDELVAKIAYLEKTRKRLRRYPETYLIDAFIASYYSGAGENEKALNLFGKVITRNPYITSLYIDIGNIYLEQYNTRMAWKCYEIAQYLSPSHPVNTEVRLRKRYLKENFPQFFMQD